MAVDDDGAQALAEAIDLLRSHPAAGTERDAVRVVVGELVALHARATAGPTVEQRPDRGTAAVARGLMQRVDRELLEVLGVLATMTPAAAVALADELGDYVARWRFELSRAALEADERRHPRPC